MSQENQGPTTSNPLEELVESAWGLIANAGSGDWARERPEWEAAAERWRDKWHAYLEGLTSEGRGERAVQAMNAAANIVKWRELFADHRRLNWIAENRQRALALIERIGQMGPSEFLTVRQVIDRAMKPKVLDFSDTACFACGSVFVSPPPLKADVTFPAQDEPHVVRKGFCGRSCLDKTLSQGWKADEVPDAS